MSKNVRRLIAIVVGELLCAGAITYFFVPHRLLSGGIGGISIMIQYLTGYSSGIFIWLLNIPLFVLGFKKLSKEFMIFTFLSTNLLSIYLMVMKQIDLRFMIDDTVLSAIFGGVINGVGMGILFRNSTSQGGIDILAMIARKEWNINIGSALMAMDFVIVSVASALFGLERGMFTLIAMFIATKCVDKVISGLDVKKQLVILSVQNREIRTVIEEKVKCEMTSMCTAQEGFEEILYCIAGNRQVVSIKGIVFEIDPHAVISISDTVEVANAASEAR